MLELNKIYNESCIGERGMALIADGSVDMVLVDLPFGVTKNSWDSAIPMEELWKHYERIVKPTGAIVLFGSQPFTSALIMSNPKIFKYCWVWSKSQVSGFLNAKKQPLRETEDICVFYRKQCTYNPQMTKGNPYKIHRTHATDNYGDQTENTTECDGLRYPKTILDFPLQRFKGGHPTQKPVALGEYLIRTYTNEGNIVLDNTCGVGSFPVAAVNTGRNFIGFELDKGYYDIAVNRVAEAMKNVG